MSNVDSWNVEVKTIVRVTKPTDNQLAVKHPSRVLHRQQPSSDGWGPLVLTFSVKPAESQALIDELEAAGK